MKSVPSMVSQQLGLLSSGATPEDVRSGQSFVSPGSLAIQTGTMKDNGDLGTIVPGTADIPIPEGYTSGGTVEGDPDLVSANIKSGVEIFGVTGSAILAEGNATNADVLEGKTYSSASGAGTGTMPNNGSLGTITPGTTNQVIPAGYTLGGTVAGSDKLIASNIKNGVQIFDVTGNVIQATGSATADKLLAGQTASNAAGPITGTMPNNGSLGTITPGTANQPIPAGYTSGGTVAGSGNLQPGNIRLGVQIFNVTGTLDPGTQTGGTAQPDQVIAGETFTNDNGVQTGTMPDNGAVTITPGAADQPIIKGYHDGNGLVKAVTFDATKVLTGTTIAGTAGTMPDNGALGTITPGTSNKPIAAGYTSGGTVAGDANLLSENIKSGVTIFGVAGNINPGYKKGSGTVTSSSTTLSFESSDGSTVNANYITVSGLNFTPSCIVICNVAGLRDGVGFYNQNSTTGTAGPLYTTGNFSYKIKGNMYVNSSGFRIIAGQANIAYAWFAYE